MTDARTLAAQVFDRHRRPALGGLRDRDASGRRDDVTVRDAAQRARTGRTSAARFAVAMPDGAAHHHPASCGRVSGSPSRGVWTGTHTGPLAGAGGEVPATGRTRDDAVLRPQDAAAATGSSVVSVHLDQLAMLGQLGLSCRSRPTGSRPFAER